MTQQIYLFIPCRSPNPILPFDPPLNYVIQPGNKIGCLQRKLVGTLGDTFYQCLYYSKNGDKLPTRLTDINLSE